MKMDTNLFWGYAGRLNSYLGVCSRVYILFGGTWEGLILIWGYASIKRLRTPGVKHCNIGKILKEFKCFTTLVLHAMF